MLRYMEQCLKGIHGVVTDSITGLPLEAEVTILNHDHHGSAVSSHLPAGDYHRPIKGGTYEVTYSREGYYPKTFTLTVADGETLVQDVQLVPVGYGIDEFGPMEQAYRITNLMGQTVRSGILNAGTQEMNVSALPRGVYLITIGSKTRKIVVE